ncbi:hypothetical protein CI238_06924 [Colletotrichum incanum]|uniref:DUF7730 domain-containing protein n=1 Tax=Colletotrichum incanum TaxID=1573173 RepID=A0A162PYQ2_COLIC|nr:hypothetical protein CI238_06924 [Colletotrichum incanum]OHW96025.1 hypothetical protein CSPAE12_05335 [Colletotrichum incanum]
MNAIPRSLSITTSISQATPRTTGGLHTPPFDTALANSNQSANVQPSSPHASAVANTRQAPNAGPSSSSDSGLESALEGLQVTGQSKTVQANPSSGQLSLEAELETNGFAILNSLDGEGPRPHYNPDEDEVDSDDGDAVSENGMELDREVEAGLGEPFNNSEDNANVDTAVDDEVNENEDAESEHDNEMDGYEDISDANGNGNDLNPSQPPIDLDRVGCSNQCREDLRRGVDFYVKQIEALEEKLQALTIKNIELTKDIDELKKQSKNRTATTWHEELRLFITNPDHHDSQSYDDIYKLCCKEENMSTRRENVHPNLRLRAPKANELQADALDGLLVDDAEDGPDPESENEKRAEAERDGPEALFVQNDEQTEVNQPQIQSVLSNFPFALLPVSIQAHIIKWLFFQENKLIHCISRLDPYMPPEEPTQSNANRSGLLHRFHLSGRSCSVTYAIKPSKHLALLSVCKRWHYLGIHAFYGLNTFAFSSLGEFGRFCTGIGAARLERIQHVELLWMGNQYLTHKPVKEGKQLKWASKRTWDISSLCHMRRLKSLIVHIDESGKDHKRRNHEPSAYTKWMTSLTAGQPNFRLTRSLRTLQGLDFIHQLRGMELIQFYDYEMARKDGGRYPIRDWSFNMGIEKVTTMPKTGDRAKAAKFENLSPVLRDFIVPDEYLEAVKGLYRHSEAFDAKYVSPRIGEEDEDNDVEIPDIMDPRQKRKATVALKASDRERFEGGKKTAPVKKLPGAFEVRDNNVENGSGSEDNDVTPKAIVLNARSGSAGSSASTVTQDGVANDYDDHSFLAGSSVDNPIELDYIEPEKTPRLSKLHHERDVKREPSAAVSVGQMSSRESERSFDSGSGLFVSSPTMSRCRSQRESTTMSETLRKRWFDESAVRKAIDLTGGDDETMTNGTGYPSSSQLSPSRHLVARPYNPDLSSVTFHPNTQNCIHTPQITRLTSDDEGGPFKRVRRQ